MKSPLALLLPFALAALPALATAGESESLRNASEEGFYSSQGLITLPVLNPDRDASQPPEIVPVETPREPVIVKPEIFTPDLGSLGAPLGSFTLSERLDSHRDLMTLQLGGTVWNVSSAADPKFEVLYLTFQNKDRVLTRRIKDLNSLRGDGVIVEVEPGVSYRFKVSVNIFSPVRGSTLHVTPVNGTQGPAHSMKTGAVLDAVKRESFVFRSGDKEFWVLFGTDMDPQTNEFAKTRSLLFINEAGLSSKAWPVPESSLTDDKPLGIALGETRISLVKSSDGTLRIHTGSPQALARPAGLSVKSWETGVAIVRVKETGKEVLQYFRYPILDLAGTDILGNPHLCKQVCSDMCGNNSVGDVICRRVCKKHCVEGDGNGGGDPRRKSLLTLRLEPEEMASIAAELHPKNSP